MYKRQFSSSLTEQHRLALVDSSDRERVGVLAHVDPIPHRGEFLFTLCTIAERASESGAASLLSIRAQHVIHPAVFASDASDEVLGFFRRVEWCGVVKTVQVVVLQRYDL